jgi:hypothetical protein
MGLSPYLLAYTAKYVIVTHNTSQNFSNFRHLTLLL